MPDKCCMPSYNTNNKSCQVKTLQSLKKSKLIKQVNRNMRNTEYTMLLNIFVLGTFLSTLFTVEARVRDIKVTVFYESKSPDSMRFITQQLKPTYEEVGIRMYFELVPFGNATYEFSNGSYTFSCQNGPEECYTNKIHACANHFTPSQRWRLLKFISCLDEASSGDGGNSTSNYTAVCASDAGLILAQSIMACENSLEGDEILAANGEITKNFTPKITHFPTIVFNDEYNRDEEKLAENCLLEAVCKYLDPINVLCDQDFIRKYKMKNG